MDLGLEGRVALVMGASRGIGRGIAAALAREGARVAIASRSLERLEEAAAEIGARGRRRSSPMPPTPSGSPRCRARSPRRSGRSRSSSLNTGGPPLGGALDHELDEWEQAYRSLVLAPRVLAGRRRPRDARARLGADRQRRLASPPASRSPASTSPTPTGWRRSGSSRRWRPRSPPTGSPSTPSPPAASPPTGSPTTPARSRRPKRRPAPKSPPAASADPEEYGDLVAFLCSERAAYITGTVIPIDGGLLRSSF